MGSNLNMVHKNGVIYTQSNAADMSSRERNGNGNRGFRIIGNTAGIKLINATDVATGEALNNKTA